MAKRGKNRKSDVVTMLAIVGYVLFLVVGFPAAEKAGGFYPALMILAGIAALFAIVYYHSRVNAYVCPQCRRKFKISFLTDLLSLNGGKQGKRLTCPHCGFKGWMQETAPDEE
jgi:DNA-directed RNA polymerase subunit RPC12/RpoP